MPAKNIPAPVLPIDRLTSDSQAMRESALDGRAFLGISHAFGDATLLMESGPAARAAQDRITKTRSKRRWFPWLDPFVEFVDAGGALIRLDTRAVYYVRCYSLDWIVVSALANRAISEAVDRHAETEKPGFGIGSSTPRFSIN